ncbi:hypothetical protein VP01_8165g1, partial [Puccinia sorghi]
SQINFELVGCAIKLVSPSLPSLSTASTTTTTSLSCDFHSNKDHNPYPDLSFILQVIADYAWLKLTFDPSSTTLLTASIAFLIAECPASILSWPSFSETFKHIDFLYPNSR